MTEVENFFLSYTRNDVLVTHDKLDAATAHFGNVFLVQLARKCIKLYFQHSGSSPVLHSGQKARLEGLVVQQVKRRGGRFLFKKQRTDGRCGWAVMADPEATLVVRAIFLTEIPAKKDEKAKKGDDVLGKERKKHKVNGICVTGLSSADPFVIRKQDQSVTALDTAPVAESKPSPSKKRSPTSREPDVEPANKVKKLETVLDLEHRKQQTKLPTRPPNLCQTPMPKGKVVGQSSLEVRTTSIGSLESSQSSSTKPHIPPLRPETMNPVLAIFSPEGASHKAITSEVVAARSHRNTCDGLTSESAKTVIPSHIETKEKSSVAMIGSASKVTGQRASVTLTAKKTKEEKTRNPRAGSKSTNQQSSTNPANKTPALESASKSNSQQAGISKVSNSGSESRRPKLQSEVAGRQSSTHSAPISIMAPTSRQESIGCCLSNETTTATSTDESSAKSTTSSLSHHAMNRTSLSKSLGRKPTGQQMPTNPFSASKVSNSPSQSNGCSIVESSAASTKSSLSLDTTDKTKQMVSERKSKCSHASTNLNATPKESNASSESIGSSLTGEPSVAAQAIALGRKSTSEHVSTNRTTSAKLSSESSGCLLPGKSSHTKRTNNKAPGSKLTNQRASTNASRVSRSESVVGGHKGSSSVTGANVCRKPSTIEAAGCTPAITLGSKTINKQDPPATLSEDLSPRSDSSGSGAAVESTVRGSEPAMSSQVETKDKVGFVKPASQAAVLDLRRSEISLKAPKLQQGLVTRAAVVVPAKKTNRSDPLVSSVAAEVRSRPASTALATVEEERSVALREQVHNENISPTPAAKTAVCTGGKPVGISVAKAEPCLSNSSILIETPTKVHEYVRPIYVREYTVNDFLTITNNVRPKLTPQFKKVTRENGGNLKLGHLVMQHLAAHDTKKSSFRERRRIKRKILNSIKQSGGRFLRMTELGRWTVLEDAGALEIIGDRFQAKQRLAKSKEKRTNLLRERKPAASVSRSIAENSNVQMTLDQPSRGGRQQNVLSGHSAKEHPLNRFQSKGKSSDAQPKAMKLIDKSSSVPTNFADPSLQAITNMAATKGNHYEEPKTRAPSRAPTCTSVGSTAATKAMVANKHGAPLDAKRQTLEHPPRVGNQWTENLPLRSHPRKEIDAVSLMKDPCTPAAVLGPIPVTPSPAAEKPIRVSQSKVEAHHFRSQNSAGCLTGDSFVAGAKKSRSDATLDKTLDVRFGSKSTGQNESTNHDTTSDSQSELIGASSFRANKSSCPPETKETSQFTPAQPLKSKIPGQQASTSAAATTEASFSRSERCGGSRGHVVGKSSVTDKSQSETKHKARVIKPASQATVQKSAVVVPLTAVLTSPHQGAVTKPRSAIGLKVPEVQQGLATGPGTELQAASGCQAKQSHDGGASTSTKVTVARGQPEPAAVVAFKELTWQPVQKILPIPVAGKAIPTQGKEVKVGVARTGSFFRNPSIAIDSPDNASVPGSYVHVNEYTFNDVLAVPRGPGVPSLIRAARGNGGNVKLEIDVKHHKKAHDKSSSGRERRLIERAILDSIKQTGGRFLKMTQLGIWVVMKDTAAMDLIAERFRTKYRPAKNKEKRDPGQASSGEGQKIPDKQCAKEHPLDLFQTQGTTPEPSYVQRSLMKSIEKSSCRSNVSDSSRQQTTDKRITNHSHADHLGSTKHANEKPAVPDTAPAKQTMIEAFVSKEEDSVKAAGLDLAYQKVFRAAPDAGVSPDLAKIARLAFQELSTAPCPPSDAQASSDGSSNAGNVVVDREQDAKKHPLKANQLTTKKLSALQSHLKTGTVIVSHKKDTQILAAVPTDSQSKRQVDHGPQQRRHKAQIESQSVPCADQKADEKKWERIAAEGKRSSCSAQLEKGEFTGTAATVRAITAKATSSVGGPEAIVNDGPTAEDQLFVAPPTRVVALSNNDGIGEENVIGKERGSSLFDVPVATLLGQMSLASNLKKESSTSTQLLLSNSESDGVLRAEGSTQRRYEKRVEKTRKEDSAVPLSRPETNQKPTSATRGPILKHESTQTDFEQENSPRLPVGILGRLIGERRRADHLLDLAHQMNTSASQLELKHRCLEDCMWTVPSLSTTRFLITEIAGRRYGEGSYQQLLRRTIVVHESTGHRKFQFSARVRDQRGVEVDVMMNNESGESLFNSSGEDQELEGWDMDEEEPFVTADDMWDASEEESRKALHCALDASKWWSGLIVAVNYNTAKYFCVVSLFQSSKPPEHPTAVEGGAVP